MKNLKKGGNKEVLSTMEFSSIGDLLNYLSVMEELYQIGDKEVNETKTEPKESKKRKVVIVKNDDALEYLKEAGVDLDKNSIVPEEVYKGLTPAMFNLCFAKVDYETVKSTHVEPKSTEVVTFTISNEHIFQEITVSKKDFEALGEWIGNVRLV